MFGFIHPYMDGNGRMARFIMNAILVSSNYPWIVIEVGSSQEYMQTLEEASVHSNIKPFTKFIFSNIMMRMKYIL